jgi:3-phenylpropionate/trans-cinnamate dioxygenase ferredoxin reductase subunit
MSTESTLTGPDLAVGVPATKIPDGGMLLGHAEGEPVLLVRQGRKIFAIGATCTHYGGPLAEGLVVGDTVRCPWHHACFSLRTGEAVRPPALNPVACWNVVRQGRKVRVEGKLPAPPPKVYKGRAKPPTEVVIVGGGAAGAAAAFTLRQEGYTGKLTMISADTDAPYDRPNLSKEYLAGSAPEEWLPLRSTESYRDQGIDLRLGNTVKRIQPRAKRVVLGSGETLSFDRLLLATGADPIRLTMPGGDLPQVFYLRTLADSRAIKARAETARRAVVVGASFIGLEVAAALRTRGLQVEVVAPEKLPLERVMGPEIGAFVRDLHQEHGVVFHLEKSVTAIAADAVTLSDGTRLPADLVVLGVGVRPVLKLAEDAKLTVDRGVMVDEYLATSAPRIYAAGDIARWPDPHSGERIRIEHWVVAERQGQTAARNLLGRRERFDAVPFFWSAHYDVTINYVGHAATWDRLDLDWSPEKRDCTVNYFSNGKRRAVATIFRDQASLEAEAAMEAAAGPS